MNKQNILIDMSTILKNYKQNKLSQIDFQSVTLSPNEKNILIVLANNEMSTPAAIADILGVSKALVTRSIKALADKKLISIQVNPDDRRSLKILLTENGEELAEVCRQVRQDFISQLTNGIAAKDLNTFTEVLTKMLSNL
ncbi:MAG: MarR family transcriptional regulator [Firmicutes bacterium]|nr:MarR family transcriptional regulator [Bacillota bacterium]